MKRLNSGMICRTFFAAAVCLAFSGFAHAKGYSPSRPSPRMDSQDIERRLNRIEDHQKKMEESLTAELKKLRTELTDTKAEQVAKTGIESAR